MRCKWRGAFYLAVLLLLFLLLVEEINNGFFFILWQTRYSEEILLPIRVFRNETKENIAIIVVLEGTAAAREYSLARTTVTCYSRVHSYPFYILNTTGDPTYGGKCPQKDFMFKRHCVVSNFMAKSNHSWFLFLDGDIGVVNPSHLLESYVPSEGYSLVFYKRIMNDEVMAGSYLAKNDEFSRRFLQSWADYEYKVPNSFHGTDNGAIHSVLADLVVPGDVGHRNLCSHLWNVSSSYSELATHEVCMQMYFEKFQPPHVLILEKGRLSWSRDGWLTNSMWSQKDFMFHGWQLKRKDKVTFARWHSPLVEDGFMLDKCDDYRTAGSQWRYKNSFLQTDLELDRILAAKIKDIAKDFVKTSQKIESLMKS